MSTLTVRKLDVDLSQGFGRHWNGGDAYRTQLFNALSMSFPLGEQLFIDSVRAVPQDCLLDPVLRAEVKDFVGQEATHRHIHVQYNNELLRQGLPYTREPQTIKRMRYIRKLGVLNGLAITCALEHYTAMLADGVLRYPEWLEGAEPQMRTLWSWHAVEETEHKGVAFDAYGAAGGAYWRRVLWYVHVSMVFAWETFLQTAHNLRQDGELFRMRTLGSALRLWFGRHGLAWHLARPALAYLSPRFHPWRDESRQLSRQLIEAWLESNSYAWKPVRPPSP
jgi:predicted metal-dependent hydrolase